MTLYIFQAFYQTNLEHGSHATLSELKADHSSRNIGGRQLAEQFRGNAISSTPNKHINMNLSDLKVPSNLCVLDKTQKLDALARFTALKCTTSFSSTTKAK
jgi:hypothetical protein